jgi:chloride channel protein, CIC family
MNPPQPSSDSLWEKLLGYARRHWRQTVPIREKIRVSQEAFHLLMAGGVGVIGGGVNVLFYVFVEELQGVLVGFPGENIGEVGEKVSIAVRVLIPTLGALAAGLVLFWGMRLAGRQGSGNILEVISAGDGRLPFKKEMVRAFSSMVSIASGASIGREGAIAQISATLASKWGQLARWQPYRLRLLVACGAASGIAAAYNAPIAGAVFAAQIVCGNFSMSLLAPLLFSSVIASMLSRNFFGLSPLYEVPSFDLTSMAQLPWFLLLGALAGVLGAYFLKLLKRGGKWFGHAPHICLRMTLGGLLVGVIAIKFPQVWGNGYWVTNQILHDRFVFETLAGIFAAKLLATVISVGSGAVGGVFTPTLFLGASLGGMMGLVLQHFGLNGSHLPVNAFALVGMGSMLAATTRSPLLAIIMILEISLNYSLMPALMLACAVATLVARQIHPHSIYTEPLKSRGLEPESFRLNEANERTVGDFMQAPVTPVRDNLPLPQIASLFLGSAHNYLPVVDANGRLVGVVSLHDLKEYLNPGQELRAVIASDIMRAVPPCLTPGQRLFDALPVLLCSEQKNVPVVNTMEEKRLLGSIPKAEALGLLSEVIAAAEHKRE